MPPPRFRRRFAWLLVLLVGSTALAFLVGGLALHVVEADLIARAGDTLALAAVDIADKLDRILFAQYSDIQILAETPLLLGSDTDAVAKYLVAVQRASSMYAWIGVVDASGRIVAATDSTDIGRDRRGDAWFQAVRDGAPIHVQEAQRSDESGGLLAIRFTAPLRGASGEFRGAVTAHLDLPVLEDVFVRTTRTLEGPQRASGIEWQFVNRTGDLLLDSTVRHERTVNLARLGLPSALLSLKEPSGYIEETHLLRKVPVITGYAHTEGYGRFPGLQWGILVRMDRQEVLAPIRATMWKLGLAGAVLWAPLFGLLLWSLWRLRHEWVRAQAADATLRETENRFQSAFEETAVGMALLDLDGRFLRVNPAFCTLVGYAADELSATTFRDITHPDDLAENLRLVAQLPAGETPAIRLEKRYRHKRGQTIWVQVSVSLVRDARNVPRYYIAQSQDITERKQAEERLRQSEERFRKTFDEAPIGMATVGTDYRFTLVNRALCDMLGYTQHELTGKTFLDITHPEDRELGLDMVKRLYAGDISSFNLEKRYLRKDREIVLVHLTVTSIRNQDSRHLYNLAMIEDVTERKRAAERLRQSEQQFRLMMENMTDLVSVLDLEGNRIYNSPSHKDIFGESASLNDTNSFADIHPKDRERIRRIFLDTVATGTGHRTEFRLLLEDGSVRHIESQGNLIRDETGTAARVLVVSRDITARKRMEDALHKREEQLWQLLGERERLSQNLHDNIIQRIYAIGLGIEQCRHQLSNDPTEQAAQTAGPLGHAIAELNAVIRDVRHCISGIEPGLASAIQLQAELAELVKASNAIGALRFTLKLDPMASTRLNPEEAQHILFIVREAISNSLRHSDAKTGTVSLQMEHGDLRLEVKDDGVGFDVQVGKASGNGLRNIAARARTLAARLDVLSKPGHGTHLIIAFHKEPEHASRKNQ